jgi:hypothetical protein
MPHSDPNICEVITRLTEQMVHIQDKLDRALENQKNVKEELLTLKLNVSSVNEAFPDGVHNHRLAHEAMLNAKKAETEFYTNLRQELFKKGVFALIIITTGLIWLGVEQWVKSHFFK